MGVKDSEHVPPVFNDANAELTRLLISPRPQGQNTDRIKLDNFLLTRLGLELGWGTEQGEREGEGDNTLAGNRQADGEKEK